MSDNNGGVHVDAASADDDGGDGGDDVLQGGGDLPRLPTEHNCRRVHGPKPG